ncbi:MAG: hypothetical protein NTX72_04690 [Candidatus Uhrbacteria bacterium]|nr:hypothetical protein [Candidatus Uhrbacteria bacterium]
MIFLDKILLYTVDNDPESRLIYLIALILGMDTIRSKQPHGALFDNEQDAIALVLAREKRHVWTVELPGEYTENELRKYGINIVIIDHHTYGTLDRAHDPETGVRKKSSLEQFLELLELRDFEKADLCNRFARLMGFEASHGWKIIEGIGILDDRYVNGLREAKYSNDLIRHVFQFREKLDRQLDPEYDTKTEAAKAVYEARTQIGDYTVFQSDHPFGVAGSIATLSVIGDSYFYARKLDQEPMIISDCGGKKLRVLNVSTEVIKQLNDAFRGKYSFTYGAGRCWGSDNDRNDPPILLTELLAVLT